LRYAEQHGYESAVIVVATRASIENLARNIGPEQARELRRNGRFRVRDVTFRLGTHRELSVSGNAPVVAVSANDDMLVELDDRQPPAICAVAGLGEPIAEWLANWRPEPVRSGTTPLPQPVPGVSSVLEAALRNLTAEVNCGSGLTDPDDKGLAVAIFRKFEAGREPYDPVAARIWAVNHGWTASGARQLEQVAEEVRNGVKHRTVRQLPANILDVYRQQAAAGS
jgi:hypothetical protein